MVSPLRVNRYTKNNYLAPKCPKISFYHYSSKKTPFAAKKIVILFLTLNGRGTAIAGWQDGKCTTYVLRHILVFRLFFSPFDRIFGIYVKFRIVCAEFLLN